MPNNGLFSEFKIRDLSLRNRVVVSPMCQYSSHEGQADDWHLMHLGSFAAGGAGLVMTEATAVEPEGRITLGCLGLWQDSQVENLKRVVRFVKGQGAAIGVQLAHAGRKGSHFVPWQGGRQLPLEKGGWITSAPSAISYHEGDVAPHALSLREIESIKQKFVYSARLALRCGFDLIELHFAHGYLAHQFLSPLSNHRSDEYGGSVAHRMRLALQIAQAVRQVLPAGMPLLVRLSATDWVDGGWDLAQSVVLSRELKSLGVDLIDVSSGGLSPQQKIAVSPHYQVPMAKRIREEAAIPTGAVGLITDPTLADRILQNGEADLVFLARELLRDPHWPLRAAHILGKEIHWPQQYERAKW